MRAVALFLLLNLAILAVLMAAEYNPPKPISIREEFNLTCSNQTEAPVDDAPPIPAATLLSILDRILRAALGVILIGISLYFIAGLVVRR